MPLYEHIFLSRQDVSAQQVEDLTKTYSDLLSENGGKVAKTEYWGVKSLSYRINKNRKAHYTLMNIDAPAAAVAEMERQMRINEDVLRFMTIRVDELEETPSVMMQKRDERSDRGDRGPRGPRRS
ncbi:30S ribosomal protein S6 [Pelagibacterium xiamenense]|uniref:30S ribosomal protein S6 n=1 Tax=Pelagibacterium xiamenense TaxID=2901140 RepID=UPI001E3504D2|nr:30S ribosomal protein S6 [Pelagibacterium xiamenense]MCD7059771.1 30S ribosomal protein S6 [Pelagibacterium xiamenense]